MQVRLKLDAESFVGALLELGELGLDLPHPLLEVASFDCDLPASGTDELLVRLKPSDSLSVFMAAFRAGNIERSGV